MTQEAVNQLFNYAHQGDVFAMSLAGQLLCEGKFLRQDISNGCAWLQKASDRNCLFSKELLQDVRNGCYSQPATSSPQQSHSHAARHEVTSNPYSELAKLIGLGSVKKEIESLSNYVKIQALRHRQGMTTTPVSLHCVFTGNPGTGKTTVARIVAAIYKDLGVLKSGHLVETDRAGLVAEYVGQTAVKTNKIIDEALDGVLFIDEAYSLLGGDNDFGSEAIATLLKRMEDDRDRLVVILAGYTNEIKEFINSNPGLQSRFNRYIQFDDYESDDLIEIFKLSLRKSQYLIKRDALNQLQNHIRRQLQHKDKHFGNGRFVRNLFEKVIQRQANRLAVKENINNDELSIITIEDIPS